MLIHGIFLAVQTYVPVVAVRISAQLAVAQVTEELQ